MTISVENGKIDYTVDDDMEEVVVDNIKVDIQRNGIGRKLLEEIKDIAYDLGYKVSLYAYPQDNTINESGLKKFYEACGFTLSPDDVDYRLYEY